MTPAFLAYQVLFYITAEQLVGAWGPADIPYSEMVNTYIPWIMVLLIGFMPAVSEEFISRAFSIPFLHKYLKFRWVAVVIAGLIWGFAHANYPQQPFYIRGIEVGIAGIVVGYIFLRFGILAPLVWHYTIDALYTSLILFRSSNSYFVVSAALSTGSDAPALGSGSRPLPAAAPLRRPNVLAQQKRCAPRRGSRRGRAYSYSATARRPGPHVCLYPAV